MVHWLALAASLLIAAPAGTTVTILEAESFSGRLDLGGEVIRPIRCHGASGDSAVQGVAEAGEWISFPLVVREPVALRDSLRSAGNFGVRRTFSLEFREAKTDRLVAIDTLVTPPGSGLG